MPFLASGRDRGTVAAITAATEPRTHGALAWPGPLPAFAFGPPSTEHRQPPELSTLPLASPQQRVETSKTEHRRLCLRRAPVRQGALLLHSLSIPPRPQPGPRASPSPPSSPDGLESYISPARLSLSLFPFSSSGRPTAPGQFALRPMRKPPPSSMLLSRQQEQA